MQFLGAFSSGLGIQKLMTMDALPRTLNSKSTSMKNPRSHEPHCIGDKQELVGGGWGHCRPMELDSFRTTSTAPNLGAIYHIL